MFTSLRVDPRTQDYCERRIKEGKTRREIAEMLHTSERTLYHKLNSRNVEIPTRRAG